MRKLTTKQTLILKAARDQKCYAGKASVKSKRSHVITIDFEFGNFNAQFDRMVELGLVELGSRTDGMWSPRRVNITAAGQLALKEMAK
jgi:hypothetical protein